MFHFENGPLIVDLPFQCSNARGPYGKLEKPKKIVSSSTLLGFGMWLKIF